MPRLSVTVIIASKFSALLIVPKVKDSLLAVDPDRALENDTALTVTATITYVAYLTAVILVKSNCAIECACINLVASPVIAKVEAFVS